MIYTRDDVKRFMIAGDQLETGLGAQSDLYMRLITEEVIHETLKEFDANNLVGIADGIADSIWVINGLIHTLDLNYSKIWKDVGLYQDARLPINNEDAVGNWLIYAYLALRESYTYYNPHDTKAFEAKVFSLITRLLDIAERYKFPMQEIWDEVSRSNFSKVSDNGKIIKNEYGKLLKPAHFSPADIESILKRHKIV